MAAKHGRDRVDVRDDPGDVRRGGEAADLQRAIARAGAARPRGGDVDAAVGVLADRDDVGARLAPRQLIGVVFVGPDEDDGAGGGRRGQAARTSLSIAPVVPEPQKTTTSSSLPLTDRWMMRRASSRSAVVWPPGGRRLRVRVGVQRQDAVADEVLDERQRATEAVESAYTSRRGPNGPSSTASPPITERRIRAIRRGGAGRRSPGWSTARARRRRRRSGREEERPPAVPARLRSGTRRPAFGALGAALDAACARVASTAKSGPCIAAHRPSAPTVCAAGRASLRGGRRRFCHGYADRGRMADLRSRTELLEREAELAQIDASAAARPRPEPAWPS